MEFYFGVIFEGDVGVLYEGEEFFGCWCNFEYFDDVINLVFYER